MPFRILPNSELSLVKSWCAASRLTSAVCLKEMWASTAVQGYLYVDHAETPQGAVFFSRSTSIGCGTLIGFVVAPHVRGHVGLQFEMEALDLAFFEIELNQLHRDVLADDAESIHRSRSLAFAVEGQFRVRGFDGSSQRLVTRMGILRSEWESARIEVESRVEMLRKRHISSSC